MFNEQEKELIGAIKQDVNTIFDERSKGLISQDAYKAGIDDLTKRLGDSAETLKAIQDTLAKNEEALKAQGLTLSEIQTKASKEDHEDIEKQLYNNLDKLKSVFASKGLQHTMTLKTEFVRSTGIVTNPMGHMLPEYGQIGVRKMSLYDLFPKIPVDKDSNGVIRYLDQTTATRNAAGILESGTYPESAVVWTGKTLNLEKIGDSLPVSEESLRYLSRLAAEIELFLSTNVDVAVETNLAIGNGTSPNLKGIYTAATAYTAGASGITAASIYDLVVKMKENVQGNATYGGKYMCDVAIMNLTDINKYKLKKDTTNNYIMPPFVSADGKVIDGITVVECPSMAANTMALGDRRFARIYEEGGYETSWGYVASNFIEDVITMKARKHMALLVKDCDATGWRKCADISAALTILAT